MEAKNRINGSENTETSEAVEGLRRRPGSLKRKATNNFPFSSTPSKRLAREKTPLHPPLHNGPCTRARQSPNKIAAAAAAAATVLPVAEPPSQPPPPGKTGGEEVLVAPESNREEEDRRAAAGLVVDFEFEAIRSRDANAHVVPAPAGWFSWTKVHLLEERALPSFFNGKHENRTSDIYLEIRNFIMKKYHSDPQTQIALADLSELSAGDSDAREEVMELLDHWGLINFHPFPPSNTSDPSTNVSGNADADSLLAKLYRFKKVEACPQIDPKRNSSIPAMPTRLLPESTMPVDLVRPPEGPAVEYHCNSCSADCSRKRYHCQKQADFDLCSECYNEGKFGSGMTPTDFILMEPGTEIPGASGGSWSDQETLLLLEALELYGENWSEIAEHVATKTKTQCILHFVQMPIEDTFLESMEPSDASIQENSDVSPNKDPSALKGVPDSPTIKVTDPKEVTEVELVKENDVSFAANALKNAFQAVGALPRPGGALSFADAGNPVMALVAFLASLVDPIVAAASARSSMKAMSEDSPGIQLAARHCFLLDDPPNEKKDPLACKSTTNEENGDTEKKESPQSVPKCDNASDEITDKNGDNALPKDITDKNADESPASKEVLKPEDASNDSTGKNGASPKDDTDKNVDESFASKDVTDMNIESAASKDVTDMNIESAASKDVTDMNIDSAASKDVTDQNVQSGGSKDVTGKNDESATSKDIKDKNDESDASKDVEDRKVESVVPTEKEAQVSAEGCVEKSHAVKETEELPSGGEVQLIPETTKGMEILSDLIPSEGQELQQTAVSKVAIEGGEHIEDDCMKKIDGTNGKNTDSSTEIRDHNLDRLKRVALATLSAAAAKAKLLADEEEEQILQLVSLIIEKQLHKLETKLGMFTEIESVIMRIREQIDKAKQRLYNERAQIIANRLGLSASMSRAMLSSSLPPSKISTNNVNTIASTPPS